MSWRADISRNVQQLRFFYDSRNPQSAGLRQFVENNYRELKALNPYTPLLVRLREGAPTQVWAAYDTADEVRELEGASEAQVEAAVRDLVLKGATQDRGAPAHPSVQYVVEGGTENLKRDPWANMYMSGEHGSKD